MRSAVGRYALGNFVPMRGVEGQLAAFLTAVTMLFVAGFKHFPAVMAAPAHLRPPCLSLCQRTSSTLG
jgi:hypothetical protein